MVNVIVLPGALARTTFPIHTEVDLSGHLEGKIAQLVQAGYIDWTTGAYATYILDANGRMSPVPAGTTTVAGHVRLSDWQAITPGVSVTSLDTLILTVLYLKDAPGKYP